MSEQDKRFAETYLKNIETFDDFVNLLHRKRHLTKWIHLIPQAYWITDNRGKLLVDFVGRFENINDDYKQMKIITGLNFSALPYKNKSNHLNYRAYYNEISKAFVSKIYKGDIKLFDYYF